MTSPTRFTEAMVEIVENAFNAALIEALAARLVGAPARRFALRAAMTAYHTALTDILPREDKDSV
jgi:hypothetical protein